MPLDTSKATDDELINWLMELLYDGGNYPYLNLYSAVALLDDHKNLHHMDAERLWRKLKSENLITLYKSNGDLYRLSDKGMMLMRKYGSYLNYIKSDEQKIKQKEKVEKNDRLVKNIGILATLGVSLLTLILTQCPSKKERAQEKTVEGIQSVEKKLDSLLHVLPQSQPTQGK